MRTDPSKLQSHGAYATWSYKAPSAKPRGFWHDDNPCDKTLWAWAVRTSDGVVKLSTGRSGFETRAAAMADAANSLPFSKVAHGR